MNICDVSRKRLTARTAGRASQRQRRRLPSHRPRTRPSGTKPAVFITVSRNDMSRNGTRLGPVCSSQRRRGTYRSEEHTSELQSLMRISYAVFCLKKKKKNIETQRTKKEQIMYS